jgi:PhnB protein
MISDCASTTPPKCTIAPWLSVQNGARAIAFYKTAFGAVEVYHLDGPEGSVVARLSVDGAEFWLSGEGESSEDGEPNSESLKESSPKASSPDESPIRMILTVADPDTIFIRALSAGASQVYPVTEGHGWRIGRVVDPFGHHWEIGRQLVV